MKKLAALVLFAILGLSTSQAKMNPVDRVFLSHKRSVLMSQTVTKNVLVHALPKAQRRLLVINDLTDDDNDDAPGPDELDLQVLYRRPEIVDHPKPPQDADLSDYVKIRLAIARAKALQKYNKKYSV
jgi:hypothetical protein